jgi:hypothetical protein
LPSSGACLIRPGSPFGLALTWTVLRRSYTLPPIQGRGVAHAVVGLLCAAPAPVDSLNLVHLSRPAFPKFRTVALRPAFRSLPLPRLSLRRVALDRLASLHRELAFCPADIVPDPLDRALDPLKVPIRPRVRLLVSPAGRSSGRTAPASALGSRSPLKSSAATLAASPAHPSLPPPPKSGQNQPAVRSYCSTRTATPSHALSSTRQPLDPPVRPRVRPPLSPPDALDLTSLSRPPAHRAGLRALSGYCCFGTDRRSMPGRI